MTMTERQVGAATVLALSGKLTSDTSSALEDKVTSLVDAGTSNIVLNLSGLTHMDSSGLGQMVNCHTIASRAGGIKLAEVASRIQNSLVMTKLIMVFDVYDSEREAAGSFAPAPAGA